MKYRLFLSLWALPLLCTACVDVDTELGRDFIARDQQYDIYSAEFPIEDITLDFVDSLSGYSSTKITVGAIRDDRFGLTTRGAAFALVPLLDTLDFGQNPVFKRFHFAAAMDSISIADESERYILQNINVYELEKALDSKMVSTNSVIRYKPGRITKGIPVLNGTDSLSFDFSEDFGKKYMQILQEDLDTITHFTAKYPGIYLTVDAPAGRGGRINLFELSCLSIYSNTYYLNGNVAELSFRSTYGGVEKDTSFVFIFGEAGLYNEDEYVNAGNRIPQYSLNVTGHETGAWKGRPVTDEIPIEGGGGIKPIVSAAELRTKLLAEVASKGDPGKVIINKASLILPYEMPQDYLELKLFPDMLSPTCRIESDSRTMTFAGLTDASNSSENQGDIDLSNLQYAPDITHHVQEILRLEEIEKIHNYDIWFLIVKEETVESAAGSSYMNDYYQNLMYASYYNNLYGYGYGYGSYGYGYNSYSNYYNYMMLAQAYASSSSSSSTTSELDLSRYYNATLNGPRFAGGRVPTLRVTYSLPRQEPEEAPQEAD